MARKKICKKTAKDLTKDLELLRIDELSVKEQTAKNTYHLQTLNTEMGELRDEQKASRVEQGEIKKTLDDVKIKQAEQGKDLGWVKGIGYFVATVSVGTLSTLVVALFKIWATGILHTH